MKLDAANHFNQKYFTGQGLISLFILGFAVFLPTYSSATPVRGVSGDLWADLVLGQTNFGELKSNEVTNKQVLIPDGAFVDRSSNPQRLYVWDSGNSRVLGFSNLANANTSGSNPGAVPSGADIVLGQPDFSSASCNGDSNLQNYPTYAQPSASSLCGNSQEGISPLEGGVGANMAVDSQGDLYVPDYFNNRVLRYNAPVASSQAADYVWGQGNSTSNFNSGYNQCGSASATSLCLVNEARVSGVGVDSQGNLWVADSGHNRVLRFPVVGGVPQATADLVLGQSNFTSTTQASGPSDATHMRRPIAVRVDNAGNVFVADDLNSSTANNCLFNGRLLVYKAPVVSGMAASGIMTNYLSWTMGIEFDPPTGGLWVNDFCNHQIILFNINLGVTPITFTPTKILLRNQPSLLGAEAWPSSGDGSNFSYQSGNVTASYNVDRAWGGIGVDLSGNVFVSGVTPMQDVWRFPAPIPNVGSLPANQSHSADWAVFKPAQPGMDNKIGSVGLEGIDGMGVAAAAGQVIIADEWHLRYWNAPLGPASLSNGKPADGFAGTTSAQAGYNIYPTYGRIREDNASPQQHLWVVRNNSSGNGFLQVYNLPLTPWQSAAQTLAQPIPALGGGPSVTWQIIQGFAPDSAGNIWITDRANSRAFRVRNPLTSPMVDIILGQTNSSNGGCNQNGSPTASTLCLPGAVRLDHHGNLYVADHSLEASGNFRTLRWDASQLPVSPASCVFNIPAAAVYGMGGNFNTTSCNNSFGECGPWEPAFTADDSMMVAGMNSYIGSRLPVILTNPRSGDNPTGHLNDYGSMFFSATFDNQDNLYMADMDRGRVLVYLQPFGPLGATPTATNTFSPTQSPTQTPTPTIGSPTATPTITNTPTVTPTPVPNCCQVAAPWIPPSLSNAAGVAVDMSRHRVYVPDRGTGALKAYDYVGLPVASFGTNGVVSGLQAFSVAVGKCAFDGVYIVQRSASGQVIKLDANGNTVWTSPNLGGGGNRSIDVDDSGTVFVCVDSGSIYQVDNTGAVKNTLTGYGFNAPTGTLKVGSTLYVDDTVNNRIVALPQTGAFTYGSLSVVVPSVTSPYCLAKDLAGNFYVASSNTNSFFVYNSAWTPLSTCTNNSLLAGAFGIALDETGAVYVAGQNSHTVAKMLGCLTQPLPPTCIPTATMTPTITQTPTVTFTPMNTATNTSTYTPTETPTETPTDSFTPTPTNTDTPTTTDTFTDTPTDTWTDTPIPTSTFTDTTTETFTDTPTATATDTYTNTPTDTFTDTPTVTPSPTPSNTFTWTMTQTYTDTPTSTFTNTPTSTFTNTATPTRTNTPTNTFTATSSFTRTNTFTPTRTSTPTRTPTKTNSPTVTKTPTRTATRTSTPTPTPIVIQAETACGFSGTIATNHTGYTGTGFVDLTNNNSSGITFALNALSAQTLTVTFRFANGSGSTRSMLLRRNSPSTSGAVTLNFPVTANWDTWSTLSGTVTLVAGNNHIRLVPTSTNTSGGPNLDQMSFISATVTNGNCAGALVMPIELAGNENGDQASTPTLVATAAADNPYPQTVLAVPNISRNGEPINFTVNLRKQAKIQLILVTLMGEEVYQTSWEGHSGANSLTWDLRNRSGSSVASGLYLYIVRIEDGAQAVNMTGKVAIFH